MSSEVEVVSRQGPFWVGVRVPVGLVKASTSVESDHLEHTVPRDTPLYAPDTRVVQPGQGGRAIHCATDTVRAMCKRRGGLA